MIGWLLTPPRLPCEGHQGPGDWGSGQQVQLGFWTPWLGGAPLLGVCTHAVAGVHVWAPVLARVHVSARVLACVYVSVRVLAFM